MSEAKRRRYTASPGSTITVESPTPYSSSSRVRLGESGLAQRRADHEAHNARLATVNIDDPDSQRSLYAQAVSAIHGYMEGKDVPQGRLEPITYFAEPGGQRFLVGDVEGEVGPRGETFTLRKVVIRDVRETPQEISHLVSDIQHCNPGVPKAGSQLYERALQQEG